jgi:hypothetical protein
MYEETVILILYIYSLSSTAVVILLGSRVERQNRLIHVLFKVTKKDEAKKL